jgi:23S rRNA pseudouridine1911/1915/1917 synthase
MLKVKGEECGLRLAAFLKVHYPHLSGKAIKRAIDRRGCRVDGRLELFAKTPVTLGQEVVFAANRDLPQEEPQTLFEDEGIRVINKPPTVVCDDKLGLLVHRLDKETSGVMVIAKTFAKQREIGNLFREREVEKEYIAFVEGSFPDKPFVRESHLLKRCVYDGQKIWAEGDEGHLATTYFSKLGEVDGISIVLAKPVTGRTHQIRVHLAALGFPVLGDDHYSRDKPFSIRAHRVMLHARKITFSDLSFSAPIPKDFCELVPHCKNICSR